MNSTLPSGWPFCLPELLDHPAAPVCEPPAEYRPAYWKDTIPNFWRRKPDHDYKSRCIYMVTMRKSPAMPTFSQVEAPDNEFRHAAVRHAPLGTIINNEIHNLPGNYPGVKIFDSVVMPDHVHFVIYISVKDVYHLGKIVAALKSKCSKAWRDFQGDTESRKPYPVFIPGYHDRISRNSDHLATIRRYVRDNPRCLMLKRAYPEYYRQRRSISIDGKTYVMIGNPFLILNPFIGQATYSSRRSSEENRRQYEKCQTNIERGGVTIGTFFAHPEKELRDKAIAEGCSIILMHGNGFSDRYAPPQPYFDLCMTGRCLIIGEETYRASTISDIREHNRAMNTVASRIASGEAVLRKTC